VRIVDTLNIFWLQGQSCSGCSISALQSSYPSLEELIKTSLRGVEVSINFHSLFTPFNTFIESGVDQVPINGDFILIIEGSAPTKNADRNTVLHVRERVIPFVEYLKKAALNALAVIAVGTCASYGGINALNPNLTGAKGVYEVLGPGYRSRRGLPVINVPGCPPHFDWIIGTLINVILYILGMVASIELDDYNRPKLFYARTVHESCPLAGFFSETTFAKKFGEPGCLLALGCKGPVVGGDCPGRGWAGGTGPCPSSGSICIGCTDPGFPRDFVPFMYYPPKPLPLILPSPASIIQLYGLYGRIKWGEILERKMKGGK
jgi:hydrogenase small subunit